MTNYIFSPSSLSFYATSLMADYQAAGSWPVDGVAVTDAVYTTFSGTPPAGQARGVGAGGQPAWIPAFYAPPTSAQIEAALIAAVQKFLDAAAQALGYDSIFTAVTYADEPAVPSFQKQGAALRAWRSTVWQACYALLAQVKAGAAPVPTAAELVATLPAFVMPS